MNPPKNQSVFSSVAQEFLPFLFLDSHLAGPNGIALRTAATERERASHVFSSNS